MTGRTVVVDDIGFFTSRRQSVAANGGSEVVSSPLELLNKSLN